MARALVTRPAEDAESTAAPLRRRGIEVVVAPLMEIAPVAGVEVTLDGVQAILATSANGVRALAAAIQERNLPVFAVGDASARTARELGFARVESAAGDVESLAGLVRRRLDPDAGALLHAAGKVVAGDLAGLLAGFAVRRLVLYRAETATVASPPLIAALSDEPVDIALFFSPRTAATFARLVRRAGLEGGCRAVVAYCLSAAVRQEIESLPWRDVRVSARPEQEALLALIDQDLAAAGDEAKA